MTEKKAYAKINLFLDIESRRTDGYHNIKSIMQTIDWFDVIRVTKTTSKGITIISDNKSVPTDSSNIVYRGAKAFFTRLNINDGINIEIQKSIPISAGMAGGSADGAATLEALNEIYDFPFTTEELIDIGKDIGADIPFCIIGGTKLISGIGEIIENSANMPDCFIVCAKGSNGGVATPQAYKMLDERYCGFYDREYNSKKLSSMVSAIKNGKVDLICESLYNIFEEVISEEHSSVVILKNLMMSNGAKAALMSGSGPSVFGIFLSEEEAQKACNILIKSGAEAKVCKPISK